MRLFWVLAGAVLAKAPHSKKEFENMDEEEHKKLDRDVFEFDSEGFDVSSRIFCLISTKAKIGLYGLKGIHF